MNLGQGANRTLAAAATGSLLNCDCRRNAKHGIDIGASGGLNKLAGVGIERFKVSTLAFCK